MARLLQQAGPNSLYLSTLDLDITVVAFDCAQVLTREPTDDDGTKDPSAAAENAKIIEILKARALLPSAACLERTSKPEVSASAQMGFCISPWLKVRSHNAAGAGSRTDKRTDKRSGTGNVRGTVADKDTTTATTATATATAITGDTPSQPHQPKHAQEPKKVIPYSGWGPEEDELAWCLTMGFPVAVKGAN